MLKKILAIAILIMFIGIYNVPNGTCIQTKKDIISSAEPTLNDNWIYSDGITQDTSHSFNKRTPQHRYQRTIYDNKQFFPKFQDILTVQESRKSSTNGKILYVGGSGAGNYTSIKSAIIYTQDGDTIFVYDDSSPYYERGIYVDKSIHIIGENKETTIIDGKQLWGRRIIGISSFGFTIIPDGVTISGFTLQNFGDPVFNPFNDGGIMISSNNNVITNNIIINSCFGIFLSGSYNPAKNNTISGNILDSNSDCGVYIQQSDDNEISMNVFRNNGQYGGLVLDQLKNNNISGNKFYNDGVYLYYADHNNFSNNLVNEKPLLILEEQADLIIEENVGQVALLNCENITIQNKNISNTTIGVFVFNSNNCQITDCIINSCDYTGMLLCVSSENNIIANNTISNNYIGIWIVISNQNTIKSNRFNRNVFIGASIQNSNSNNISTNIFLDNNCGLDIEADSQYTIVSDNTFIGDGVWLFDAWNSYFSNNYVNSKPLLYLDRQSDLLINESAGQVILINCVRVEVTEQEISNTTAGIILIVSDDCIIHKNILTTNKGYNLFLSNSKGNTIFENTMSTSSDSLTIYLSKENIVYKNIITDSERGIYLIDTQYNNISRNTIKNNRFEGIVLDNANNNSVSRNTIEKNGGRNQIFNPGGLGIFLYESSNNQIEYNNFLRNARDAYFGDSYSNIWEGNYWNRPRLFPKIIRGENDNFIFDKMFNFDWHPALEQNTIY